MENIQLLAYLEDFWTVYKGATKGLQGATKGLQGVTKGLQGKIFSFKDF